MLVTFREAMIAASRGTLKLFTESKTLSKSRSSVIWIVTSFGLINLIFLQKLLITFSDHAKMAKHSLLFSLISATEKDVTVVEIRSESLK